jgi:hypothetical protein
MSGSGSLQSSWPMATMTEQKSRQTFPSALLIAFGNLTCAQEITQSFVSFVRYPAGREIAGAITASQIKGITTVSFNAIAGLPGNQRWCNYVAVNAESSELPVENITSGASFIAGAQFCGRSEFLNAAANRLFAVGDHTDGANFTIGFGNSNSNGVGVDIETDKSYFVHDRLLLSFTALCWLVARSTGSIIRATTITKTKSVFFYSYETATPVAVSHLH